MFGKASWYLSGSSRGMILGYGFAFLILYIAWEFAGDGRSFQGVMCSLLGLHQMTFPLFQVPPVVETENNNVAEATKS